MMDTAAEYARHRKSEANRAYQQKTKVRLAA